MQNGPDGKLDRRQGCGVGMVVNTDLLSFAKLNVAELFEGVCFSGQQLIILQCSPQDVTRIFGR
jgi:hypothetical protein